MGSVFLRHLFYWAAGGPEPFLGEFDQATFDRYAPQVWAYLNEIEPNLWREGATYPDASTLVDLLANQEVAFAMDYDPARASTYIREGVYPETIRTFVFETGTLANNNYVAIPFNAANPAGAMVIANYLLSPEFQLVMADPAQWGWLLPTDPARYPAGVPGGLRRLRAWPGHAAAGVLAAAALPEPDGDWVQAMEEGWVENVLKR